MDKTLARQILKQIQTAADEIAMMHALQVVPVNARFDQSEIRLSVRMTTPSKIAGRQFTFRGNDYEFIRYDRQKRKYPVIARRLDTNTQYRLPRAAMPADLK